MRTHYIRKNMNFHIYDCVDQKVKHLCFGKF